MTIGSLALKRQPRRYPSAKRGASRGRIRSIPSAFTFRTAPESFEHFFGIQPTVSGVNIGPTNAFDYTAFYCAVQVLAQTIGSLPLKIFRRLPNGGKEEATDHPLWNLIHNQPNPFMSSFMFRETGQGHLAVWGNFWAEIETDRSNNVIGLWPVQPDIVTVKVVDSGLNIVYEIQPSSGERRLIERDRMLHVRALGTDGILGMSPVRLAREAIGLGRATEQHGSSFFGQGARPGGVLKHPEALDEEAHTRLRRSWERMHRGSENAHRIAILEEGMSWQQIGIPNEDAQFLETRKFQVIEIARIFRIPPHLLMDLERATFSNIEQQGLEFVIHTLRPWLVRWEQELNFKLLNNDDEHFFEFVVEGLLRGDIASRYQAYQLGITNGVITRNEARIKENLNPYEGGDDPLVPLNMQVLGEEEPEEETTPPPRQPTNDEEEAAFRAMARSIWRRAYSRVLSKEIKACRTALRKSKGNSDKLASWARTWYGRYESEVMSEVKGPACLALMQEGKDRNVAEAEAEEEARNHVASSRNQIIAVCKEHSGEALIKNIEALLESWEAE